MEFNIERVKTLEQFHLEDPSDPFPIYALALEWEKQDHVKSKQYFDLLLDRFSDYLPTYYHAANNCAKLGDTDRAKQVLREGMVLAKTLNDQKTNAELQTALEALEEIE